MLPVKRYILESFMVAFIIYNILDGSIFVNHREEKSVYYYSFYDKAKIKYSNLFWKIVDILSCKSKTVANINDKFVAKEYANEIEVFDICKSKKILHIGCGSYPITSMTLSSIDGSKIVGIDISQEAVDRAKKLVSKRKLDDRIKIDYGDGSSYPLDGFDAIIVSSCSIPKYKILEHLFENAPSKCKIIVREQYGPNSLVSDYIKLYKDKIGVLNKIDNNAFPTSKWESFCLVKK